MDFMLGKFLPGQRNGSQMWHEAWCCFLSCKLKINGFSPYPSLLGSTHGECLMLLHVDDVSCLSTKNYLHDALFHALNSKYRISCDIMAKANDELTFLMKKNMIIISEPKHV